MSFDFLTTKRILRKLGGDIELKRITVPAGSDNIPAPFTELIGLEVVDNCPGRMLLSTPHEKPDKEGVLLSSSYYYTEISYSNHDGMLSQPCLIVSSSMKSNCPSFFRPDTQYQALLYAFEEVTDTLGMGLTLAKGWHAVNPDTFANEPFDPKAHPFIFHVSIIEEYAKPDAEAYLKGLFTANETITFTIAPENIYQSDDRRHVSFAKVSEAQGLSAVPGMYAFTLWTQYIGGNPIYYIDKVELYGKVTITYEKTIVPISKDYLGGVCLPVVELETEISDESTETFLSAADSAKMDALNGHPCILKFAYSFLGTAVTVRAVAGSFGLDTSFSYLVATQYAKFDVTNIDVPDGAWAFAMVQ